MRCSKFQVVLAIAAVAIAALVFTTAPANAADLYSSGAKPWNTTTANWGVSGGPYNTATWNNATPDNAIFEGSSGTVALGEAISVKDITFDTTNSNYNISGNTLNFATGGSITSAATNERHTITSAIAGSPTVNIAFNGNKDYGPAGGSYGNAIYEGLHFAPTSGSQTLGTINTAAGTTGDKSGVFLEGTTTGNSVAEITYILGHYGSLVKRGTGTWTVGNVTLGTVRIGDGTLVVNGTITTKYQGFKFADPGGTLAGNVTINSNYSSIPLLGGCSIAPGTSIGTITIAGNDELVWDSDDTTAGMVFDLSDTDSTSDLLDVSGAFTKGTGTDFLFDFIGGKGGETYTLVNFGSTDFSLGDFAVGSGMEGTFAFGQSNLQYTTAAGGAVIPEPSTFLIWGLGLLGLLLYARRRRSGS